MAALLPVVLIAIWKGAGGQQVIDMGWSCWIFGNIDDTVRMAVHQSKWVFQPV
jgi:hypothetical protein